MLHGHQIILDIQRLSFLFLLSYLVLKQMKESLQTVCRAIVIFEIFSNNFAVLLFDIYCRGEIDWDNDDLITWMILRVLITNYFFEQERTLKIRFHINAYLDKIEKIFVNKVSINNSFLISHHC